MSENYFSVFENLGWDLKPQGSEMVGDCPFCGKERKLYVNKRGVFDCKVCGTSGNHVTVFDALHEKVYKPVPAAAYKAIARRRGLPEGAFKCDPNLGYDVGRFVWLVRRFDGTPQAMRWCRVPQRQSKNKLMIRNYKGMKLGLLGAEAMAKSAAGDPVYVTEGEWDRIALLWVLHVTDQPGVVVALPGASNFNKDWAEYFRGRHVWACYDNDPAGREGTVRCFNRIGGVAQEVNFIHWPSDKPDGYDMHDLVVSMLKKPANVLKYIREHSKRTPTGEVKDSGGVLLNTNDRESEQSGLEPISCDELHRRFSKWMEVDNYDAVDVSCAVAWATYLQGNPLWMFMVAPPSGSKSEVIMPLAEWWRCHSISSMTSKSFCSGFNLAGGADPSLLKQLEGQKSLLCIKDTTPLLSGRMDERDEVFGILRDAYDGSVVKVFGNGVRRAYDKINFGILAGVTPFVDTISDTALGERFLKFRLDKDTDRDSDIDRAIRAVTNCGNETEMREDLKDAFVRCMQRPFDPDRVPIPTQEDGAFYARIAYVTANLRAVSPMEKGTEIQTMAPMVEAPPRLATQLVKFSQGLALHYGVKSLSNRNVRRLARRVALHTPDTISTKIIQTIYLFDVDGKGMPVGMIIERTKGVGRETVRSVLGKFQRLGVVCMEVSAQSRKYRLKPSFRAILDQTKIFDELPENDVFFRGDAPTKPRKLRARKKS